MLKPFSEYGLNLTKIESRPSRRKAWEYFFYIDIEGHVEDLPVKQALEALRTQCQAMKVLGSYPRTA
jgi:chorismate mutase/prephenate dehydratase